MKWHLAWSLSCAIQGQRKKEAPVGAAIDRTWTSPRWALGMKLPISRSMAPSVRPVALGRGEQDRLGDITVRHGAD